MPLPRRVPWLSRSELEEVFAWIFSSDGSVEAQQTALDRMTVWLARGYCPQAIESTADLLDAALQAARGSLSVHSLRLVYSMAIIRFVNGLVDPVQQGYYARSIGSIAAQIGLPSYFVDLRHAATHENLPSLAALRDAVKQALDWLYRRYWLPQMQEETSISGLDEALRVEIAQLLASYRDQQATSLRDASQADSKKLESTLSAVEKLVGAEPASIDEALSVLAEQLACKGVLVVRNDSTAFSVSSKSQIIWMPLLQRLDDVFEGFASALLLRMLDTVCSQDDEEEMTSLSSSSIAQQLAAWSLYIATHLSSSETLTEIIIRLCLLHPNELTISLLAELSKRIDGLQNLMPLAKVHTVRAPVPPAPEDVDIRLDLMQTRLQQLRDSVQTVESAKQPSDATNMQLDGQQSWQLIPEADWKPCPIGCLPQGRFADLTWPRPALQA